MDTEEPWPGYGPAAPKPKFKVLPDWLILHAATLASEYEVFYITNVRTDGGVFCIAQHKLGDYAAGGSAHQAEANCMLIVKKDLIEAKRLELMELDKKLKDKVFPDEEI